MTPQHDVPVPAIFLDRDGTIMRDVDYCARPEDVHLFDRASESLRRLKSAGYKIVIITNQSGIGRGYFSEADYRTVEREVERQIGDGVIDASYFCPDLPDSGSTRRKPAPAMVLEAAEDLRLDLTRSYFIGDKRIDAQCGRNAGVRTILVKTGKQESDAEVCADLVAQDLGEATEMILRHEV